MSSSGTWKSLIALAAAFVLSDPARAATACSEDACGACTPPTAAFGMSTLISSADLPDTGDRVTGFVDPNDETSRRFVVSQQGIIWVWNGSQILATPFL